MCKSCISQIFKHYTDSRVHFTTYSYKPQTHFEAEAENGNRSQRSEKNRGIEAEVTSKFESHGLETSGFEIE